MKIYHTETQADYDALMVELEAEGCVWATGRKSTESKDWTDRKENTCVKILNKRATRGSIFLFKAEYPQVPIEKYKAKVNEMKFTKENVEKAINEYFRQAGFESCGDLIAEIHNLDDTPEKVVVPKFVAEWIEFNHSKGVQLSHLLACYREIRDNPSNHLGKTDDAGDWFVKNPYKFVRAYEDGYEVEKEPLYRIELPAYDVDMTEKINQPYSIFLGQNIETGATAHYVAPKPHTDIKMLFTEAEIKAIDKRYWAFAVPITKLEELK